MPNFRSIPILVSILPFLAAITAAVGAVSSPPAEVDNLQVAGNLIQWDVAGSAVSYRVYRAGRADLPNFCGLDSRLVEAPAYNDPQQPAIGTVRIYLAGAVNSAGEGGLGTDDAGVPRENFLDCDLDGDGVRDSLDNCPIDANPGQEDSEFNGIGDACRFEMNGMRIRGRMSLKEFPIDRILGANEMWGYVSPAGEEYAIIGFRDGTAFVRVTAPQNPGLAGFIDGAGVNKPWRDMAVFGEHAYIVTDGAGVGLQIADLSGIDNDVVTLVNTSDLGMGFTDAHNVFVNEETGYLYLAIPDLNAGLGITAVNLNADPADPAIAGFWTDAVPGVRCHDLQVVSYDSGPAIGREIAYCFAENDGLVVVDVTDKAAMFRVGSVVYPNLSYTHQGWLSEDRNYVFIGDELDELQDPDVTTTTTYIADVSNPLAPTYAGSFTNNLPAIDHNLMVRGEFVYEANYSSGLRVFSSCNINDVHEVGYLDTHPENDDPDFVGTWGVYSRLPSGTVVVSDIQRGLFVVDPSSTFLKVNNKCTSSGSHDPVCDSCIAAICAGQPSCCDTLWDVSCIEATRAICGSLTCAESAGSCPHGLCAEGVALTPYCDVPPSAASCVEAVCQEAPDCCLVAWDAACIGLIDTACGLNCD